MALIPDNILLGSNDDLPGLLATKLPAKFEELALKTKLVPIKTIYCHNIRISSMNEIEKSFTLFLKS